MCLSAVALMCGAVPRRIPVAGVEVKIGSTWVPLKRSANNQWPYYNTNGPWESSFPMPIRVTSAAGETIEDSVPSSKGGEGTKQFSAVSSTCICAMLLRCANRRDESL